MRKTRGAASAAVFPPGGCGGVCRGGGQRSVGRRVAAAGWAAAAGESEPCGGACWCPSLRNKWDLSDARARALHGGPSGRPPFAPSDPPCFPFPDR